ncbi:DNA mismatch repair protein [Trema orientale]|uniref:DNA mismatch repair protein n=1 Tax=Trema orientale TaxID=63057 RepID=A0A2P5EB22_TREOI|nr:DNA mismatch repair protein [Trema orientale]
MLKASSSSSSETRSRSIKSMAYGVGSSVRSGVILFDITRVVEELVFNSLDAAASKISVFIGVGTCFVKVVDDGSGITRDGLVLLGQRYATSKYDHLADKDTETRSFGFRGEALASISDVSLLEVVTKASGRPNGYRKVMKGSKCLYLGIYDDKKDVGTTVVVRDLFYNQPVRRKYIQSSEDVLFCTLPSSPMSLLTTYFGIERSTSLHELRISGGKVKLSGYMSGPCDNLSIKAFQYVYINSRFVCKGPIHKLVNQLAARFECCDKGKAVSSTQNRKRSRPQTFPAFILNISCPQSFYDLTFEPSKTYVEFKYQMEGLSIMESADTMFHALYLSSSDWVPILTLLDEAIQDLWKENMSYADVRGKDLMLNGDGNAVSLEDLHDDNLPRNSTIGKKKCRLQNHEDSSDLISSHLKMLSKEDKYLSHRDQDIAPNQHSRKYYHYFKETENEMDSHFQIDSSLLTWDHPLAQRMTKVSNNRENQLYISDNNSLSAEDYFLVNEVTSGERRSVWEKDSFEANLGVSSESAGSALCCQEFTDDAEMSRYGKKPFLKSCSLRGCLLQERALCTDGTDDVNFSSLWVKDSFEVNLGVSGESADSALCCQEFTDDAEMSRYGKKPLMKSCSLRGCLPQERALCTDDACNFKTDCFKIKRMLTGPYDRINISDPDGSNQSFDYSSRTLCEDKSPSLQPFLTAEFGRLPRAFERSIPLYEEHIEENDGFSSDSVTKVETIGSDHLNSDFEWCPLSLDSISQTTPWDVDNYTDINILEDGCKSVKTASIKHFSDREENDCRYTNDLLEKGSRQEKCTTSCSYSGLADAGSDRFFQRHDSNNKFPPKSTNTLTNETDWLSIGSLGKNHIGCEMYKSQRDTDIYKESRKKFHFLKGRSRSHSAPPFCRSKRRFFTLSCHSSVKAGNGPAYPESCERWKPIAVGDSLLDVRLDLKNLQDLKEDKKKIKNDERFEQSICFDIQNAAPFKENISKEFQDSLNCGTKWRNCCPQTAHKSRLHDIHDQNNILDIASGFLHLAGDSLVPESINKKYLEGAIVLRQVDKKFIPVVAGRTLAVVDQHAADERIRLEELRQKLNTKVLSGEAKTITFLDAEKELMLPEIGHQLLHNYTKDIKEWGWICNIHAQDSRSFKRSLNLLHSQPTVVKLIAVPCILGVNLSDIDLMEFLQQLADTDGSSMIPPSVLRVLNSKACRGAIMFGDSLLPSECSLIIEELKQTSLCFQCAHGRPTIAPLVNLEALHKQITKIGLLSDDSNGLWHGLRRHELSLERAAQRLTSASC